MEKTNYVTQFTKGGRPIPTWNGRPGIDSGKSRAEVAPTNERPFVPAEVKSLANEFGLAGIPLEAATKLAVIIIEMQDTVKLQAAQIQFLQERVNQLEAAEAAETL